MYLRKRIPSADDSTLINLAVNTFNVNSTMFKEILKKSKEVIVICNDDDDVVGFLCYRFILRNIVYIDYVVIDPDYQGKGVAQSFLPDMIQYARNLGVKGASGFVSGKNSKALEIFKKWGFQPIMTSSKGTLIGRKI